MIRRKFIAALTTLGLVSKVKADVGEYKGVAPPVSDKPILLNTYGEQMVVLNPTDVNNLYAAQDILLGRIEDRRIVEECLRGEILQAKISIRAMRMPDGKTVVSSKMELWTLGDSGYIDNGRWHSFKSLLRRREARMVSP